MTGAVNAVERMLAAEAAAIVGGVRRPASG